jgi:hypothetical protein
VFFASAKVSTACMVSRRLAEGKLEDGFTVRDLMRKQWSGVITIMQAESVLATLEENAHVRPQESGNELGRPTICYFVNPQLLEPNGNVDLAQSPNLENKQCNTKSVAFRQSYFPYFFHTSKKKSTGHFCQVLDFIWYFWWAVQVSNLRPLQCECSALPLS